MRVAIYSRKSRESEQGDSVRNQIKIVQEYFTRQGNCTFEVFEDEGFSGGNTNRPDFQRMLNKIRNNEIDIVGVYKIDRIARNIVDFVNTYDLFQKNNVALVSVTEAFDATSPMGKLIMMILATFAEMERETIRQRIKDNKLETAKTGKWSGGTRPFGYNITPIQENDKIAKYLEVNENEREMIIDIFDKYLEFNNLINTSKYCFSTYGILNTPTSLKRLLESPVYVKSNDDIISYLKHDENKVIGKANGKGVLAYGYRSRFVDNEKFYVISKHEGLITAAKWLKVQSVLQERTSAQKHNSVVSYLAGIVTCSKCGEKMWLQVYSYDGKKYYMFECKGRSVLKNGCANKGKASHLLEEAFEEHLKGLATNKVYFYSLYQSNTAQIDNKKSIELLKKEINLKQKNIESLFDKMILIEGIGLEMLTKKINGISLNINELKIKLEVLEKEELFKSTEIVNSDYIYNDLKDIYEQFRNLTVEEKRDRLKNRIKYLLWDGEYQTLSLKFL